MLTGAAIITLDLAGRILSINKEFRQLTGYSSKELEGVSAKILRSPSQSDAFLSGVWQTVSAGRVWCGQLQNQRKDGSMYWSRCTISPDNWENGLHHGYRVAQVQVRGGETCASDDESRGCGGAGAAEGEDSDRGLGPLFWRSPDPQL